MSELTKNQEQNNVERINTFLQGHNPMERIITMECDYQSDKVSIVYVKENGEKRIALESFMPFLWSKHTATQKMFDGDRKKIQAEMRKRGIACKALQITNEQHPDPDIRLQFGYKYMFYATKPMSYNVFLKFFSDAGVPLYPKKKKGVEEERGNKDFMALAPIEQHMIRTGKRLFKGYDGYDELKRLIFDLETQGLNPRIHAIDQIGIRTNKGFEKIITVTGNTPEERKESELKAIVEFFCVLKNEKPDIIIGHNSENFDWNFIIVRLEVLGTTIQEVSEMVGFNKPIHKRSRKAVLKLGGEMEDFYPTIMWGHNIIDSLHAVRRAQAIDSSMQSASLKYVTKYLKLKKDNRVYLPGNKIGSTWLDTSPSYAFNNEDGNWYKITEQKGLDPKYEITTGRYIAERYLLDDLWETDKVELKLNEANFLISKILPTSFTRACTMGTAGIWKLILLAWCYENNLAIPATAPNKSFTGGLSRLLSTGFVKDVAKFDYNSLYPSIMLTWMVASPLDISNSILTMLDYVLTNRELYKGLKKKASKQANKIIDIFRSKLTTPNLTEEDRKEMKWKSIDALIKKGEVDLTKEEIKELLAEKAKWDAEEASNDRKQQPLKTLGNSMFGSFGCPAIFPMGNIPSAEKITCIGRMSLRLMISHFTKLGYAPIVGDTDGFNFSLPVSYRYTEENPYIGKGLNRNVKEGETYTGYEADVAEFNDLFMRGKMGLGIDEIVPASINFARKNYCDLLDDGSVKLVGNTVKSRRLSGFIASFLEKAIPMLLNGEGKNFIDFYNDYISKIYNYQIPLKEIATKGKIKKTIKDYIADCQTVTKAGNKKSRQVWYELAIRDNISVNLDDTLYFVNIGKKNGDKDVSRITKQYVMWEGEKTELVGKVKSALLKKICEEKNLVYKGMKDKEKKELLKPYVIQEVDEVIINCKLVPNDVIESEEDVMCNEDFEYNVIKYIDQFNSRIKPLLVCFHPDIRNKILITNPDDKQYFSDQECEMVSGFPNKETDQDTYEALMTPERKEMEFWTSINEIPPFVKECDIDWDDLVAKFNEIKEKENTEKFQVLNEEYLKLISQITDADIEEFEEKFKLPAKIDNMMVLNASDLTLRFKELPDMVPTTGGYLFDDIRVHKELEYDRSVDDRGAED